jgi:signal transduction histidine kinase
MTDIIINTAWLVLRAAFVGCVVMVCAYCLTLIWREHRRARPRLDDDVISENRAERFRECNSK